MTVIFYLIEIEDVLSQHDFFFLNEICQSTTRYPK